ncbi:MAG: glycosyltransferase family 39 protein [bacterium]|nr:glycosyltransferase family 39 protein [bacterium]MDZ4231389.1 glycosyltransferase family 39 protein [Patescibacteria group bacterium]
MKLGSKIMLAVVLALSLLLMFGSSLQESAVMDELAHIPAGYAYVNNLDYRLNPEHPPIVKMAAGLPLLFLDLNFPTDNEAWTEQVNGQWDMGYAFLYQSGNDADQIIQWSRLGPMILTLILVIFVYIWSRELMGKWWALLPAVAVALSPHFLAHGHYVTTDIGATLGILISLYYFNRYLASPTKKKLLIAGVAFGVAQLMKFSAIILVGHMLVMVVIYAFIRTDKIKGAVGLLPRYLGKLFLIFAIGALTIYPLYALTTANYPPERQLSDTTTILQNDFQQGPLKYVADATRWSSNKPLLRPYAQYMLGLLMVFKRSTETNTLYFMGQVNESGGPTYFPIIYGLKETLPMLIFLALGLLLSTHGALRSLSKGTRRLKDYLNTNLHEFSALLFIFIYLAYSISSPLNIGFRHLMPVIPLFYILATGSLRKYALKSAHRRQLKTALVLFLFLWQGTLAFTSYPYYLPYFNEFVGTDNGWRYVTDSNYDWGQDLKRLAQLTEREGIDRIAVHYFGAGSPEYYLGDGALRWESRMGNPIESGVEWLAVSVNQLQASVAPTAPGFRRDIESEYRWLEDSYNPDFIAGKSIFVYKLGED